MTEAKWLMSGTKPGTMLRFLKDKANERKLRLFAVAVHREYYRLDPRFSGQASLLAADTAKGFAEANQSVDTATRLRLGGYFVLNPTAYGAAKRQLDIADVPDDFRTSILRCIFGNPFRPITLDASWLTPTVMLLALAIYHDRGFERMPVLGDALEEAGCTNGDILDHCRQTGQHAKGCFVVDLILGKS